MIRNYLLKDSTKHVDLRTVNGIAGLFAFTASGDKDWQGTGNAFFFVSDGAAFNQCGDDNTNCPKQVDFEVISFAGNSDVITYLGQEPDRSGPSPRRSLSPQVPVPSSSSAAGLLREARSMSFTTISPRRVG
jgi:hypothetical protein